MLKIKIKLNTAYVILQTVLKSKLTSLTLFILFICHTISIQFTHDIVLVVLLIVILTIYWRAPHSVGQPPESNHDEKDFRI